MLLLFLLVLFGVISTTYAALLFILRLDKRSHKRISTYTTYALLVSSVLLSAWILRLPEPHTKWIFVVICPALIIAFLESMQTRFRRYVPMLGLAASLSAFVALLLIKARGTHIPGKQTLALIHDDDFSTTLFTQAVIYGFAPEMSVHDTDLAGEIKAKIHEQNSYKISWMKDSFYRNILQMQDEELVPWDAWFYTKVNLGQDLRRIHIVINNCPFLPHGDDPRSLEQQFFRKLNIQDKRMLGHIASLVCQRGPMAFVTGLLMHHPYLRGRMAISLSDKKIQIDTGSNFCRITITGNGAVHMEEHPPQQYSVKAETELLADSEISVEDKVLFKEALAPSKPLDVRFTVRGTETILSYLSSHYNLPYSGNHEIRFGIKDFFDMTI